MTSRKRLFALLWLAATSAACGPIVENGVAILDNDFLGEHRVNALFDTPLQHDLSFNSSLWDLHGEATLLLFARDTRACHTLFKDETLLSSRLLFRLFRSDERGNTTPAHETGVYTVLVPSMTPHRGAGLFATVLLGDHVSLCPVRANSLFAIGGGEITVTEINTRILAGSFKLRELDDAKSYSGAFEAKRCQLLTEGCGPERR